MIIIKNKRQWLTVDENCVLSWSVVCCCNQMIKKATELQCLIRGSNSHNKVSRSEAPGGPDSNRSNCWSSGSHGWDAYLWQPSLPYMDLWQPSLPYVDLWQPSPPFLLLFVLWRRSVYTHNNSVVSFVWFQCHLLLWLHLFSLHLLHFSCKHCLRFRSGINAGSLQKKWKGENIGSGKQENEQHSPCFVPVRYVFLKIVCS